MLGRTSVQQQSVTCATWWIRQAVAQSLTDQSRTIHVPVHIVEVINKIVRTSRRMLHEMGREPTPGERAEKLYMPIEKIRRSLKIAKEPISLQNPDRRRGGLTPRRLNRGQERDPANRRRDPVEAARDYDASARFAHSARGTRAAHAIRHEHRHTLEEVGLQFSVAREIRQIEARARKLKHPSRSRLLRSFLDN